MHFPLEHTSFSPPQSFAIVHSCPTIGSIGIGTGSGKSSSTTLHAPFSAMHLKPSSGKRQLVRVLSSFVIQPFPHFTQSGFEVPSHSAPVSFHCLSSQILVIIFWLLHTLIFCSHDSHSAWHRVSSVTLHVPFSFSDFVFTHSVAPHVGWMQSSVVSHVSVSSMHIGGSEHPFSSSPSNITLPEHSIASCFGHSAKVQSDWHVPFPAVVSASSCSQMWFPQIISVDLFVSSLGWQTDWMQ